MMSSSLNHGKDCFIHLYFIFSSIVILPARGRSRCCCEINDWKRRNYCCFFLYGRRPAQFSFLDKLLNYWSRGFLLSFVLRRGHHHGKWIHFQRGGLRIKISSSVLIRVTVLQKCVKKSYIRMLYVSIMYLLVERSM